MEGRGAPSRGCPSVRKGALTAITGSTTLLGIIGDPVAHSLSPALHNAAFAEAGLDWAYVPLRVTADELGAAVKGLWALGFRGANVTVPHKVAVVPHLARLEGDAALLRAVNTIVRETDGLVGHNTDVEGVRLALLHAAGDRLHEHEALLLGAGGAARAAALALVRSGLRLTVVNRTLLHAQALAGLVAAAVPGARVSVLPLNALDTSVVQAARLVVNATSLGMGGEGKVPRVLADNLTAGQVVFDVVYSRAATELLQGARDLGAVTVDGLEMLLWQAAAAFELWTGLTAPTDVMRHAATR
jgi:shikimate dehydrogenase